ncbi:hypothetical protein JRQ81_002189 [Phrynocephalus forsythii]|uniref:Myosin XVB n=1 Tax=Phrynocephalus forsythii TaxID=171643 RepID=A0A9Q0XHW4_9SAUR|nr:hypothetical protein JRQ81_002189 [Phrynocephalus forsythii]
MGSQEERGNFQELQETTSGSEEKLDTVAEKQESEDEERDSDEERNEKSKSILPSDMDDGDESCSENQRRGPTEEGGKEEEGSYDGENENPSGKGSGKEDCSGEQSRSGSERGENEINRCRKRSSDHSTLSSTLLKAGRSKSLQGNYQVKEAKSSGERASMETTSLPQLVRHRRQSSDLADLSQRSTGCEAQKSQNARARLDAMVLLAKRCNHLTTRSQILLNLKSKHEDAKGRLLDREELRHSPQTAENVPLLEEAQRVRTKRDGTTNMKVVTKTKECKQSRLSTTSSSHSKPKKPSAEKKKKVGKGMGKIKRASHGIAETTEEGEVVEENQTGEDADQKDLTSKQARTKSFRTLSAFKKVTHWLSPKTLKKARLKDRLLSIVRAVGISGWLLRRFGKKRRSDKSCGLRKSMAVRIVSTVGLAKRCRKASYDPAGEQMETDVYRQGSSCNLLEHDQTGERDIGSGDELGERTQSSNILSCNEVTLQSLSVNPNGKSEEVKNTFTDTKYAIVFPRVHQLVKSKTSSLGSSVESQSGVQSCEPPRRKPVQYAVLKTNEKRNSQVLPCSSQIEALRPEGKVPWVPPPSCLEEEDVADLSQTSTPQSINGVHWTQHPPPPCDPAAWLNSETLLPRLTVENLSKWALYKDQDLVKSPRSKRALQGRWESEDAGDDALEKDLGHRQVYRDKDCYMELEKVEDLSQLDGFMVGTSVCHYLLEKCRVVFQSPGERSFHVFYEFLVGLPTEQKERLYLQESETYFYLNQGGVCELPGKQDHQDFLVLTKALQMIGLSDDQLTSVWRVLAGILQLGNICFTSCEKGSFEFAIIPSETEIQIIANLLHISADLLQRAITQRVTETCYDRIFTPLSVESAIDTRDAIAKILYSLLFDWLLIKVNEWMEPLEMDRTLGIVDIYGFENLGVNSLEQLCINFADEHLQHFFHRRVIAQEEEEYIQEGLTWSPVLKMAVDPSCLDLIVAKPYGILHILDDQTSLTQQATDHTFLQKCHYHHSNSPCYVKPKLPLPAFTVQHGAGSVTYQVHKFLNKNRDQLHPEVLDIFSHSHLELVSSLFQRFKEQQTDQRGPGARGQGLGHPSSTLVSRFQQSLQDLTDKLNRSHIFFVRCIKPNCKKLPNIFDTEYVASQLRHSGILEAVCLRKEGYPIRIPFRHFLIRYGALAGRGQSSLPEREGCAGVLSNAVGDQPDLYQIGASKVFLKEKARQTLERRWNQKLSWAIVTLQRNLRSLLNRRRFQVFQKKVTIIQAYFRGYLARKRYQRLKMTLGHFRVAVLISRPLVHQRKHYYQRREDSWLRNESLIKGAEEHRRYLEMDVRRLEIPAELAALLSLGEGHQHAQAHQVTEVSPPEVNAKADLSLPSDINSFPFSTFVRAHFQEMSLPALGQPLPQPLTRLDAEQKQIALQLNKLILRFIHDKDLESWQEEVLGNYLVSRGLASLSLRNELLCQVATQVWRNPDLEQCQRGWVLMAALLGSFAPSPALEKPLLKFVSDYGLEGYNAVCQHKLLMSMRQKESDPEVSRSFPPTRLEWTTNRRKGKMVLEVYTYKEERLSAEVESWTTGEQYAGWILRSRGLEAAPRGWSVSMSTDEVWHDLPGCDFVLDLIGQIEESSWPSDSTPEYPITPERDESFFHHKASDRMFLSIPPAPDIRAPSAPPPSLPPDYDGRSTNSSRSKGGLDYYVDDLFRPLSRVHLSDTESEGSLTECMKGGGKIGPTQPAAFTGYSGMMNVPAYQSVPVMGGMMPTTMPPQPLVPPVDPNQMAAQQQAFINQQALLLTRILQGELAPDIQADSLSKGSFQKKVEYFQKIGQQVESPVMKGIPPSKKWSQPKTLPSKEPERPEGAGLKPSSELTPPTQKEPEPSQEIQTIVAAHPGPPPPPAKPVRNISKPFLKKSDPKEEALAKLGIVGWSPSPPSSGFPERNSPPPLAPPVKLSNSIKEKQLPLMNLFSRPPPTSPPAAEVSPPPPPPAPLTPPPPSSFPSDSATVEKKDLKGSGRTMVEEASVKTQLLHLSASVSFSYANPSWKLFLRKEVFYPKENFSHPYCLNLLCDQIIRDTYSESCVRISREERRKMKDLLMEFKVNSDASSISEDGIKKRIVVAARDNWANYFSRLFPVKGENGSDVQILGVSHRGLQLLKRAKEASFSPEHLKILCSYSYADVLSLELMGRDTLQFSLKNEQLILHSLKACQIRAMVELFLRELKKDSNYVMALRSYVTDDKSLLTFKKGEYIQLMHMEGLEPGWMFGSIGGRSGLFPSGLVQVVAAPDYLNLCVTRQEEVRKSLRKSGKESQENSVPSMPLKITTNNTTNTHDTCHYTMAEFASAHFRDAQSMLGLKGTNNAEQKDPAVLVQHTKVPIQKSLLFYSDDEMNDLATKAFLTLMRFMGDKPGIKHQHEVDYIYKILQLCKEKENLCDEVYCQVIKQITQNPQQHSCSRGWQLLSLLTGYFLPSSTLMPYATKYLQQASADDTNLCKEIAWTCQRNLRKNIQNGGRRHLPSRVEMEAFLKGHTSRQVSVNLPGGQGYATRIKTFTLAEDLLKEIAELMEITEPVEIEEFALLVSREDGKMARPLHQREYIQDYLADDKSVVLNFCRMTWKTPLHFENENYINIHYNQVLQNYMTGKLLLHYPGRLEELVGTLAGFQHWAKGAASTPSIQELTSYIPAPVAHLINPETFQASVSYQLQQGKGLGQQEAKIHFLERMVQLPLFGYHVYPVERTSMPGLPVPCFVGVNEEQIIVVDGNSQKLHCQIPLRKIRYMRTLRPLDEDGCPGLEVSYGSAEDPQTAWFELRQAKALYHTIAIIAKEAAESVA